MVQIAAKGKQNLKKISQFVKNSRLFLKTSKNCLEIGQTYAIMERDSVHPFSGSADGTSVFKGVPNEFVNLLEEAI